MLQRMTKDTIARRHVRLELSSLQDFYNLIEPELSNEPGSGTIQSANVHGVPRLGMLVR